MPSRILKESICTSENLATISAEAEVLFYRLIVKADDFGLYHGNPKIIASLLFPLSVPTERKVASWLSELCNAGLVATYTAAEDGKKYLKLLSWDKHQNRRAQKSKFPLPCSLDSICTQQETNEKTDTCGQMQTDSSVNVNVNVNENEKRKRVTAQNGAGGDDGFERFWSVYPRRVGKKDAVKVWNQIKPDEALIDLIVQGVERWKRSEQWTKDEGRFIPYKGGLIMYQAIIANLVTIGWAMLIFLAAYLSNVTFSLWYNIKIQNERFSREKLIAGGLKVLTFIVGLTLLCVSVTTLPLFANEVGWAIPDEYADMFADLVIVGAVLLVSCKYIKEAFTKFTAILNAVPVAKSEDEYATNQIGFNTGKEVTENEQ